ncbi:hypothetical protein CBS101457_003302 [Exobasidium rhododendri]|nr:hypothetical protein CBS101457_003302 [Exobasidium rhododendri]
MHVSLAALLSLLAGALASEMRDTVRGIKHRDGSVTQSQDFSSPAFQWPARLRKRAPVEGQSSRSRKAPRGDRGKKRKTEASSSSGSGGDKGREVANKAEAHQYPWEGSLMHFTDHIVQLENAAEVNPAGYKDRLAAIKAQMRTKHGYEPQKWSKPSKVHSWKTNPDGYFVDAEEARLHSNWHFSAGIANLDAEHLYQNQMHELARASNRYKWQALLKMDPRPAKDIRDHYGSRHINTMHSIPQSVISRLKPFQRKGATSIDHDKFVFWDKVNRDKVQRVA